jgi:excisionase family DNA binding protein
MSSKVERFTAPLAGTKSDILTLGQAALYLRVSKAHLSNVINGKVAGVQSVRFFRLGRRVLIRRDWIDDWLETQEKCRRC